MKYLFLLFLIFSCSKTSEENCFIEKEDKTVYEEEKPFTAQQILENKPDYLEVISLKKFRSFRQDSIERNYFEDEKLEEIKWEKKKEEYKDFNEKFDDQFSCSNKQLVGTTQYCLGRNNLGYWLLKIENNKTNAYFLGLSFSHYYFNEIQKKPIINKGFLELEGSFVKIVKVAGLPGYDDYSAIEDGKLFKIKLENLTKDSDRDGYNDIFEKSFGLNPNNKDTDGDGMDDFNDLNPMFKSENNKFTQLYEMLLPDYGSENLRNNNYYFEVFISDCDYFHQISPKYHVLFVPEDLKLNTNYVKITDVSRHSIDKIRKNKNNPNIFYIKVWGTSSMTDYSAEYKDGKWILEIGGGYII
ncbi:hypothetical protein IX39_09560 [Chryseobacterium formosense]|uniref:Uncharacterized protein n=1 Tax=Chryseobacterium formosense TaxID=236814 RepID=A0A085Z8T3_9FLAO|nr:hypothetical protein [Chryseobacterium formosense]KFF00847.1 hypothetical protein IX39_09560 [Chryseobacterium formosense]SFT38578.1 hypothetical protein SAMN05421857_0605 [Chryseobacterium formosense]